MEFPSAKFCSRIAFVTPAVFVVLWICLASADGKWTFGEDALSKMGISDNAAVAIMFNGGCMLTGALGMIVGLGFCRYEKGLDVFAGIFYAIGMFFLILVGVFNMSTPYHHFMAQALCVFAFLSIVLTTVCNFFQKWYSGMNIIFLIVVALAIATQKFPMWEAISVIVSLMWAIVIGYKMAHGEEFPASRPRSGRKD